MKNTNENYRDIGERIRQRREKVHFTREQLSELTGLSSKFLYEIEFGRKGFSAISLYKISKALGISCEYIMTGEEEYLDEGIGRIFHQFSSDQKYLVKNILLLVQKIGCEEFVKKEE